MARRCKLDKAVQDQIVAAIRAGNDAGPSANSARVSRRTYYRWLKRGESNAKADAPFRDFRDAIKKAEAEAVVHAVAVIWRAMPGDWRAAMAWLERRHPDRWGRRNVT